MSENQIAGLSMSVDVSQVNDATKSLANFKQANNETKRSVEDLAAAEAWATKFQAKVDAGKLSGEIAHVFDVRQELTVQKVEVAIAVKLRPKPSP